MGPVCNRPEEAAGCKPAPRPAAPADKVRLRFRKDGPLRLLSHHDLLRCFERLLRRAGLPVHRTHGFHPHPRLVFALSLPLGVIGCEEVAELELDEPLSPEQVFELLRGQAPPGLEILSARRIALKTTAQVRALCYRLPVPADRAAAVQPKLAELLAAGEVWATRSKPQPGQAPTPLPHSPPDGAGQRVNLRPFLRDLRLVPGPGGPALEIDLWLTPAGTARPAEVLALAGLADLLDAGAVLERSRLELYDEIGP